jgi:hypothetical protein
MKVLGENRGASTTTLNRSRATASTAHLSWMSALSAFRNDRVAHGNDEIDVAEWDEKRGQCG